MSRKKFCLKVFFCGMVFIPAMIYLTVRVELYSKPWLKTAIVNANDLGLFSQSSLLYLYNPDLFWKQVVVFAVFGSLFCTFFAYVKKYLK